MRFRLSADLALCWSQQSSSWNFPGWIVCLIASDIFVTTMIMVQAMAHSKHLKVQRETTLMTSTRTNGHEVRPNKRNSCSEGLPVRILPGLHCDQQGKEQSN
jgi:hypothetical protein